MSIQEHLNKIRNAIYGREVRESIAKGIETAYDDASENGNANMEVNIARGTHPNLRSRLEEVDDKQQQTTAQLAERPTQAEVNVLLGNISDGTPLFVDNIGSMTDVKRIYVNTSDGYIYAHNGTSWQSTGTLYQATGIQTRSITPEKTDFIKLGKNKAFTDLLTGMTVTAGGAAVTSSSSGYVHVSLLEPNKTYTITKFEGGNRFRIATFLTLPNVNDLPLASVYGHEGSEETTKQTHTFTNTQGANFLVLYTGATSKIPPVQVEEGEISTNYEAFDWDMNVFGKEKNDILLKTGKNLSNNQYVDGLAVDVALPRVSETTVRTKTLIVPIENGKEYTLTKFQGGNRFRLVLVDEYPSPEKLPLGGYFHQFLPDNAPSIISYTFKNEGGRNKINYLVLQTNTSSIDTPHVQVEEGSHGTAYEHTEPYYFTDDITGTYASPNLPSVAVGDPIRLMTETYQDLYGVYDDMMTHSPEYITRTLLGNEVSGLPIYQYHFKPMSPDSDVTIKKPKIIIFSGIHANEKMAIWGMAQFLKQVVENWQNDEILEFIRWNMELVVLPLCNPWGISKNSRENFNSVDLNRNFPTKTYQPNFERSGEFASSELETQVMVDVIKNNLDADYVVDCHTWINGAEGVNIIWGIGYDQTKPMLHNLISTLSRKWKKEYEHFPQGETMFGHTSTRTTAGVRQYAHELGFKSMTVETVDTVYFGGNTVRHDAVNVNTAVDIYGNVLTAIAKNL